MSCISRNPRVNMLINLGYMYTAIDRIVMTKIHFGKIKKGYDGQWTILKCTKTSNPIS